MKKEEISNIDFIKEDIELNTKKDQKILSCYMWFWSIMLFVASIVAMIITKETKCLIDNLLLMWLSPSKLVTDYFSIGSLASTFMNASLCGFGCNIVILITKAKKSSTLLAGYFLVIAHCFYGLNFLNMWLPFLSIFLYAIVKKKRFGDVIHLSMFATSLSPFVSDFLFRYTLGDKFVFGKPQITLSAVLIVMAFFVLVGFVVPAFVSEITKMHRGYNLYKAGISIGLIGFFVHSLFYNTFGVETPDSIIKDNAYYTDNKNLFYLFVVIFFVLIFTITFLIGFFQNNHSIKGYKKLWNCDGWKDDFPIKFKMPLTFINIGIYGMSILIYYILIIVLTKGAGFSGPTTGAIIAAITFSASGQTPRNVWPIAGGFIIFMGIYSLVYKLCGLEITNTISTQAYLSAFAFATGLCPFSGRYGIIVGMIAGIIDAIICTSTVGMHGGFVLYNGGFTAGFSAILLLPILDFYKVKPIKNLEEDVTI